MKEKFIGRTESDRIQIAILDCLEGIRADIAKLNGTKYDDEQIVAPKQAEEIKAEVEHKKNTTRKKKGE